MTLSDIKWGSVAIVILALFIIGLAVTVKVQHTSNVELAKQKEQAEQGKATAEAITNNVITAVTLINDLSRATHEEKTTVAADAGERVITIQKQLSTDTCANTHINSDAVEQLRGFANGLRQRAIRADQH
ncbi:hypothetical protein [Candidatus Pantoea multigeneris]|uniref:hypothetical protein n=1 Tax=Candidatus Pantoea multigeneris TaxID=2608357 RepID=UPI00141E41CA|nr:hypothetical protein [Pantoea multigeneris]